MEERTMNAVTVTLKNGNEWDMFTILSPDELLTLLNERKFIGMHYPTDGEKKVSLLNTEDVVWIDFE
ncbi:hypothetical protein [Bacillus cereus]|uniref:hypothetical protein n=1 Tax=Bacillus cereus TaxID=1396 RepID=UPI000BF9311F|nr:hypothetical protein [Bacillus cereus]PER25421.1 hypothetical protein CN476_12785 [Bacillus cereus]